MRSCGAAALGLRILCFEVMMRRIYSMAAIAILCMVSGRIALADDAPTSSTNPAIIQERIAQAKLQGRLADRIVAWVDDQAITLTELEGGILNYQSEHVMPSGELDEKAMRMGLERYIDDTLILKAAEKAKIEISAEMINNRVDRTITELEKRNGGEAELDRLLAEAGQDRDKLRTQLREQMQRDWTIARAVASRFQVTDADVEKYRKERGEEGEAMERYRLSQLFFPVDPKADAKTWEKVKQRAFDARMTAGKADDFLQAAKEIAGRYGKEGAEAAPLGNVTARELQPEIAAAVANLEVGRISEPIRTSKGIHVLYLEQKSSAKELLFAERYEQERAKWAQAAARRQRDSGSGSDYLAMR